MKLPAVSLLSDELQAGPWVFARQVDDGAGGPEDGALVEVRDRSGRFVGHALYNRSSDIRLRMLARGRRTDLDRPREFLLRRLKAADDLRRRTLRLAEVSDAYRVAHAEGDDLPGLVVDRLGSALVCEHHALGFWRLRREVEWALGQLYPGLAVVHRVPRAAARAEGFQPEEPPADVGEVVIREHGLEFAVRPGGGEGAAHKTGWFCDQRDNRLRIGSLAAGREVVDLFCNAGGFALQAARAGARRVRAVDLDEAVLERARDAASRNGLEVELVHADAFDVLRELRAAGEGPELLVVDPHKMIRTRAGLELGMRKYLDLNALALAVVRPRGLVATFSCSGLVSESAFAGMLFQAARRAGRGIRHLGALQAGPDHPQRPDFARSRYLKGALLWAD